MWTGGLSLTFAYWRNWGPYFLLFWPIAIAVSLILPDKKDYVRPALEAFLLAPLQTYVFTKQFLDQEPISNEFDIDGQSKLHVFAKIFLSIAIAAAAAVLVEFAYIAMRLLTVAGLDILSEATIKTIVLLTFIAHKIGVFVVTYILTALLSFVPVLAINGIPSPFKTSLAMIRGKTLRVIGNLLMLSFTLGIVNHLAESTSVIVAAAAETFGACAVCAFFCHAGHILYGEHIAATLGYERRATARAK